MPVLGTQTGSDVASAAQTPLARVILVGSFMIWARYVLKGEGDLLFALILETWDVATNCYKHADNGVGRRVVCSRHRWRGG